MLPLYLDLQADLQGLQALVSFVHSPGSIPHDLEAQNSLPGMQMQMQIILLLLPIESSSSDRKLPR